MITACFYHLCFFQLSAGGHRQADFGYSWYLFSWRGCKSSWFLDCCVPV